MLCKLSRDEVSRNTASRKLTCTHSMPQCHPKQGKPAVLVLCSLEIYAGLMNNSARRLTRRLDKAADSGELVNMRPLLAEMALDIVGKTAFGCALHGFRGQN